MFLFNVCCRNSLKRAHVFGILFGFTDAVRFDLIYFRIEIEFFLKIMFFAQSALFTFGAWRVQQGAMT
jgi:hypothetical protein